MNFQVNLNICRVCMKGDDVQTPLFDAELQKKFEYATHLMLNPHDNMPKNICTNCELRLKVSYDFIQLAHNSEENLKAFLTKIKNDFQVVTQAQPTLDNINEHQDNKTDDNILIVLDKQITTAATTATTSIATTTTTTTDGTVSTASSNVPQLIGGGKKMRKSLLMPIKRDAAPAFSKQEEYHEQEMSKNSRTISFDAEEVCCGETTSGEFVLFESNDSECVKSMVDATFAYDESINMKEIYMSEMSEPDEVSSETEMEVLEEVMPVPAVAAAAIKTTDSQRTIIELQSSESTNLKEFVVMMSNNDDDDDEEESNTGSINTKDEILWVNETAEENSIDELHIYEDNDDNIIHDPQEVNECISESTEFMQETDTVVVDIDNSIINQPEVKQNGRKSTTAITKAKNKKNTALDNTRFYCLKCDRDFSTKTNLTRHMVTHDGTRPYMCKICGNSFTQNGTLKQHMYTHTGEKPFVCKYCDRGFTQCKSLVFHMRRHTGDKPFHCEHCDLFFRQKDGLKVHILKHHMVTKRNGDSQTHTCIICKMVLSTKNELLIHMKKHLITKRPNTENKYGNADIILELMEESELLGDEETVRSNNDEVVGGTGSDDDDEELLQHSIATQVVDITSSSTDEPRRVKKYICRICYKCFAIRQNLIRHMSIHDMLMDPVLTQELNGGEEAADASVVGEPEKLN